MSAADTEGAAQPLALGPSVLLAAALASYAASNAGVRALVIKGPTLERHLLRAPRTSSDADLLVEPDGFQAAIDALAAAGWVERPRWRISDTMTTHSISLLHAEWPCDIDVHSSYPGFLAPPGEVFDALWETRTEMEVAGVECAVPDRASSAVILALHSLRSSPDQRRHRDEYDSLVERIRDEDSADFRQQLSAVAASTGAAGSLEPFLSAVGADVPAFDQEDPALTAWIAHVNAGNDTTAVFGARWRAAPWRDRPRLLWWALWPTNDELRLAQPERDMNARDLAAARVARLGRALAHVPSALGARRRARKGEWDSPYVGHDQ